ncbi:helix-hairpin-helix domain-containing protein [Marinobacter halodurans]|uniref:Helix-hairpin-helix domain-containing protein n=1 Tax=Marinobacter halodurans TaxID=2528979 RepID=A0ABY1ZF07_9GAMM|nr:helix-hairpin-helix domain-containing protein [Marinobacter halodurans]TBW48494.1 helix-hairpin-helix domain-containing protein [Marinobacter halodurans]
MKILISAFFVIATLLSGVAMADSTSTDAAAVSVNINKADAKTLSEKLDGIGEVKAQAIVDYRKTNGPFKTVADLDKVDGIGKATLDSNRSHITVQ